MEIIDRILKAEREASEIRRAAQEEAARILRDAQEDFEAALTVGNRKLGDREFLEKLAVRKREWELRAGAEAEQKRRLATERLESAADFIVESILASPRSAEVET